MLLLLCSAGAFASETSCPFTQYILYNYNEIRAGLVHNNGEYADSLIDYIAQVSPTHDRSAIRAKLLDQLAQNPSEVSFMNAVCDDLNGSVSDQQPHSVSLVFAASFMGAPMSYFGHTFLLFHGSNTMFSKTVSFMAEVPDNAGALGYVYNGLSGGFNGSYQMVDYWKMIESYNIVEQRSLIEYHLNLTPAEIAKMLTIFEANRDIKKPYKYFTNNCSYEILWLIESARDGIDLRSQFFWQVAPYDTITTVINAGLVTHSTMRHSLGSDMFRAYKNMSMSERKTLDKMLDSRDKQAVLEDENLTVESKQTLAGITNDYYDFLFKKHNYFYADFDAVKQLDHLPKSAPKDTDIIMPIKGAKIAVGTYWREDTQGYDIHLRPALNNRYEQTMNFQSEDTLEILSAVVRKTDETVLLKKLDILHIESFNNRFLLYKPFSYRLRFAYENRDDHGEAKPLGEFGLGVARQFGALSLFALGEAAAEDGSQRLNAFYGGSLDLFSLRFSVERRDTLLYFGEKSKPQTTVHIAAKPANNFSLMFWSETQNKEFGITAAYHF
ncbi:hypothetical protein FACS1894103_3950 [Campylobacterota bacterium]|nr:hypothetical protein FACS1894103_3950 [Campylobacterota bacterium]